MKILHTTLFLLAATLTGCGDAPISIYLYGPHKSCFPAKDGAACNVLKPYDKVDIKLLVERQEVSFVRRGLDLDESNTEVAPLV